MTKPARTGTRAVVVGGGFAGLAAARLLADEGCTTTLVERAPVLGGVNRSIAWRGHHLDFGCHLFGNESAETTELIVSMGGGLQAMLPVQPRLASRTGGRLTPDLEYPDLSGFDDAPTMLAELVSRAAEDGRDDRGARPDETLAQWLARRFGPRIAERLGRVLAKVTRLPASAIAARAAPGLPLRRALVADRASATLLKRLPEIDDRLGTSWGEDPMRFHGHVAGVFPARALYPRRGGMGGWTDAALADLEARGVDLRPGTAIERLRLGTAGAAEVTLAGGELIAADRVIWTSGLQPLVEALGLAIDARDILSPTPICLYWFEIDPPVPGALHYAVSYDAEDLLFRATCPVAWGAQTNPEGRAHLCCEVPCDPDDPLRQDPAAAAERVFAEAVSLGMARGRPYAVEARSALGVRHPKDGYESVERAVLAQVAGADAFVWIDPLAFSKAGLVDIVRRAVTPQKGAAHAV